MILVISISPQCCSGGVIPSTICGTGDQVASSLGKKRLKKFSKENFFFLSGRFDDFFLLAYVLKKVSNFLGSFKIMENWIFLGENFDAS